MREGEPGHANQRGRARFVQPILPPDMTGIAGDGSFLMVSTPVPSFRL
jgi:hypothetical protein